MKLHEIKFSGALIERGFWLYIWRVTEGKNVAFYVGRTGDSSSRYAASPFSRLGQHLDIRPTATANMLLRNLKAEGFNLALCGYELISVGPLFPEQDSIEEHRRHRDIIAPLEGALAAHLKDKGLNVIGTHPKPKPKDEELFNEIIELLKDKF